MTKIVSIFGAPRSGTSWLGQIFNSSPNVAFRYQPLFSYAFKERINETSTADEINLFHRELLETNDEFVLQRRNVSGVELDNFTKTEITHLVWKEVRYHNLIHHLVTTVPDIKIIGIIRHPCEVISSWMQAPKEFNPNWDIQEEWQWAPSKNLGKKEEFYGYERWKELVHLYDLLSVNYPYNFKLVKYEDIRSRPMLLIEELFNFCRLPLMEQTISYVSHSRSVHTADPYGTLKVNTIGESWREILPANIQNQILISIKQNAVLSKYYG